MTGLRLNRREVLAAGAGVTAVTLAGAAPSMAASRAVEFQTDRLRRLLSAELLILYCYQGVLGSSLLSVRERTALEPLKAQEEAHVHALRTRLAAIGGTAPTPPASVKEADHDLEHRDVRGRLGELKGREDALRLLLAVERVVVGAYFVALTKIADPSLITLSAQMMANDAQHEAIIGELLYAGNTQKAVPYALVQGTQ